MFNRYGNTVSGNYSVPNYGNGAEGKGKRRGTVWLMEICIMIY